MEKTRANDFSDEYQNLYAQNYEYNILFPAKRDKRTLST